MSEQTTRAQRTVSNPYAGCMNESASEGFCWACFRILWHISEVKTHLCSACQVEGLVAQ
jgi:hypothetical protein